jgi:hypothetical protein
MVFVVSVDKKKQAERSLHFFVNYQKLVSTTLLAQCIGFVNISYDFENTRTTFHPDTYGLFFCCGHHLLTTIDFLCDSDLVFFSVNILHEHHNISYLLPYNGIFNLYQVILIT